MAVATNEGPAQVGEKTAHKNVIFLSVALAMLAASASQTIVSPAMPRIIADLGGVSHYSLVAISALLASAVSVPIVGKLSDLYGRREFYLGGIIVFMLGSALTGAAQNFWWLIVARIVQGIGMGTVMALSQTLIGDILSPRERGKYMGYLGAVFGLASIAGPLAGGWITDNWSWRWLFYINLPLGIVALAFIAANLHLPHVQRSHRLDVIGFVTLGIGLSLCLLATSWGGTQYPWSSWQIITLYAVGVALLIAFVLNETRAEEPVIPLRLWKNSVFTLANLANISIAMGMFGAIYYIPVFAQGVLGVSATSSGTITMPMTIAAIPISILVGRLITRTGRYKIFTLLGAVVMGFGYFLLSRLGYGSTVMEMRIDLIVLGLGLGAVMQTFTLVVQNATSREDLGVATATSQFTRSVGATVGIAIFGSIMTSNLKSEVIKHVPQQFLNNPQVGHLLGGAGSAGGVGAVLDPSTLANVPVALVTGIREGLAAALHPVFVGGLPILALAFIFALFIKEVPLRKTAFIDENNRPVEPTDPNRDRLLAAGLTAAYIANRIDNADGESSGLIRDAAQLVPSEGGLSERERALRASDEVFRPLSRNLLLAYLSTSTERTERTALVEGAKALTQEAPVSVGTYERG